MSMKSMFFLCSLLSGANADNNETTWVESNFEPEPLYGNTANVVSTEENFSVEKDMQSLRTTVSNYIDGDNRKVSIERKRALSAPDETRDVASLTANLISLLKKTREAAESALNRSTELLELAMEQSTELLELTMEQVRAPLLTDLQVVGNLTRAFANNRGHTAYQSDISQIMSLLRRSLRVQSALPMRISDVSDTLISISRFEMSSLGTLDALSDVGSRVTALVIQNDDSSLSDEALESALLAIGRNVDSASSDATRMQEQSRDFFISLDGLINLLQGVSDNEVATEALGRAQQARERSSSVTNKQNALGPAIDEIAAAWREFRAQHP